MDEITSWLKEEDIAMAYLFLKKQIILENNVLLHLKKQISDFEFEYQLNKVKNTDLESDVDDEQISFKKVLKRINDLIINNFNDTIKFKKIIKKIDENSLENKISEICHPNNEIDISNEKIKDILNEYLKNSNTFKVENKKISYNYIIDCPIELHILSILWLMKVGKKIDENLSNYIHAFRLNKEVIEYPLFKPIFKRYTTQYQKFKNDGLKKYEQIIEEDKEKAVIINLDLKKFYYSIDANKFEDLKKQIVENHQEYQQLTTYIFEIINIYSEMVKEDLKINNMENLSNISNKVCLPIGLYASPVLANHFLKPLDDIVINKISPAYYGRYVDDVFFVFKESKENKLDIEKNVYLNNKLSYFLEKLKNLNLELNHKKTIIEWSSKNMKNSQIEALKNKLDEQTSTFALLTNENDLNKLYNKIRFNNENMDLKDAKYNISVYLTKLLYKFELTGTHESLKELELQIEDFLQFMDSQNIFKFIIYLEKIFILLIMGISSNNFDKDISKIVDNFYNLLDNFYKKIQSLIDNLENTNPKNDLKEYLKTSFLFAVSLNPTINFKKLRYIFKEFKLDDSFKEKIFLENLLKIAQANMFNRNFINYPLLNYLNFSLEEYKRINFLNCSYLKILEHYYTQEKNINKYLILNSKKIKLTPKFLHLNHINIFFIKKSIWNHQFDKNINIFENIDIFEKSKEIFKIQFEINSNKKILYTSSLFKENLMKFTGKKEYEFNYFKICSDSKEDNYNSLKVGVSSIPINDSSILEQLNDTKKLSLSKKEKIIYILNEAKINKINFLVFSELSIPIELLKLVSEFSRINNIVITGGLEYIFCDFLEYDYDVKKFAYNCLFTILPFHRKNWTKNTEYSTSFIKLRLKNDYAPSEINTLLGRRFSIPIQNIVATQKKYDLFSWNGVFFTNFNCFELTDINARGLFKNYIDLISASVYNKDLFYFKNIIDSTSRDLHTYIIQSNTSKYGDSLIIKPAKKDYSLIGSIGGGNNPMLLVNEINIKKLREFQLFELIEQEKRKEEFKFCPPGIDPNIVKLRIQNNLESLFENKIKYPGILEEKKKNILSLTFYYFNNNNQEKIDFEDFNYSSLLKKSKIWIKQNKNLINQDIKNLKLSNNQSIIFIEI